MSSFFGEHERGRSAVDYWRVVRRYSLSLGSITAVFAIIGFFIGSSIPPQYNASASLHIKPTVAAQSNNLGIQSLPFNMSSLYLTQLELIRSRAVAETVIKRLNLVNHKDFTGESRSATQSVVSGIMGEKLARTVFGNGGSKNTRPVAVTQVVPGFNERLFVRSGGKSDLIVISYDSGDPKMAAAVANEVAAEYIQALTSAHQNNINETIGWLTTKLDEAKAALVQSEASLRAFQRTQAVGDSADEVKLKSGRLSGISAQLIKARTTRMDLEIRLKQLEANNGNFTALESIRDVVDSAMVQKIREQEADQTKLILQLSERYGEKHPQLIRAKAELKHIHDKKQAEINKVIQTIRKEYEYAKNNENALKLAMSEFQKESTVAKGVEFQLAKLEMEVSTNREIYDLLLTRMKEADLTRNSSMIDVSVVDIANPPAKPYKPNLDRIVGGSALAGFLLGFFLSLLRDSTDTSFKTGEDLVDKLGVPLLGIFPMLTRKDLTGRIPERIVSERPQSAVAESVSNIRTNIIFQASNDPPQVIMLTSAMAGEGKTTLSNNLAISLARLGPTLFLELDTRRPRMAELMRSRASMGVFEFVTGKGNLKECLTAERRIKNLYTMSVVSKPAKPLEFLSSKRFKDALKILRTKFKYIVVDTPPLLPVSDAIVLGSLADGVILAVAAESTKYPAAKEALSRLQSKSVEVIGAVLTKGDRKTFKTYGKDYYYGYDSYYGGGSKRGRLT